MSEAWLEELPLDECLVLLRGNAIGRIASVTDDQLTVLPVNYRVVEAAEQRQEGGSRYGSDPEM